MTTIRRFLSTPRAPFAARALVLLPLLLAVVAACNPGGGGARSGY